MTSPALHNVLIVHGWQGSAAPHWQAWLADQLQQRRWPVRFPELPQPDTPVLHEWLDALDAQLAQCGPNTVVICHSLGSLLWLHHASRTHAPLLQVRRVLLVAPPGPSVLAQEPLLSSFAGLVIDRINLQAAAPYTALVCTHNDPYCVEHASDYYGKALNLPTILYPDHVGHVNVAGGLGPWPQVLQWAISTTTPDLDVLKHL